MAENGDPGGVIELSTVPLAREVTRDLKRRLLVRYAKGYLVMYEVPVDPVAGGAKRRQLVDALAIGMWPSTKHIIHGFEIKVSRQDLRKELDTPTKAAAAVREVDRFWLVVPSLELVTGTGRQENLLPRVPVDWGILVPSGLTLKQARAPKGRAPVDTASRRLLVACVAKATNSVLETVELMPTGTEYQRKRSRRRRRAA